MLLEYYFPALVCLVDCFVQCESGWITHLIKATAAPSSSGFEVYWRCGSSLHVSTNRESLILETCFFCHILAQHKVDGNELWVYQIRCALLVLRRDGGLVNIFTKMGVTIQHRCSGLKPCHREAATSCDGSVNRHLSKQFCIWPCFVLFFPCHWWTKVKAERAANIGFCLQAPVVLRDPQYATGDLLLPCC